MEFVYALTHMRMPGLVKIGMAKRAEIERLQQLSTAAGGPVGFKLLCCVRTSSAADAEEALHRLFGSRRVSDGGEFFRIDNADEIRAAFELLSVPPWQEPTRPQSTSFTGGEEDWRKLDWPAAPRTSAEDKTDRRKLDWSVVP